MTAQLVSVVVFAAGLVLGYLAGDHGSQPPPPAFPQNYDPARSVASDALKVQQEATDRCWKLVVQHLNERSKAAHE